MPETISEPIVPNFDSIPDLRAGLEAKRNFDQRLNLYPRDGSKLLGQVEEQIAHLTGVEPDQALAYNTGMSAVTEAIDVGLKRADSEIPTVAVAQETYSQTQCYVNGHLQQTGNRIVYFDSGDPEAVAEMLVRHQPDVVVVETVANYTGVPVLDTDTLLRKSQEQERPPLLVIDNTLPLSTAQPLSEKIYPEDKVIVVESGTKSYTFNAEQLGIAFTRNEELITYLRQLRRTRGSIPGAGSLERISSLLPEDQVIFDKRNFSLYRSTAAIAIQLAAAAEHDDYNIYHPILPNHENHDYYRQAYPHGGTPVFYVVSNRRDRDQYDIGELLWTHPGVREQTRLGQSFGFEHTRIVTDENLPQVRIAGGSETDGEALGEAMAEALYS